MLRNLQDAARRTSTKWVTRVQVGNPRAQRASSSHRPLYDPVALPAETDRQKLEMLFEDLWSEVYLLEMNVALLRALFHNPEAAARADREVQHLPLGVALREHSGDAKRERLLALLLPELAKHHQVTAVVDQGEVESPSECEVIHYQDFDRGRFDRVICQLGNNPHHEFVYREAIAQPSVVVLHDYVLHHLIVETTLARGHGQPGVLLERQGGEWGLLEETLAEGKAPRGRQLGMAGKAVIREGMNAKLGGLVLPLLIALEDSMGLASQRAA